MTYESVPKNLKEKLQKEHESLNPLKLKRELDILRKTVFEIQKTGAGNRKTLSAFGDS
jgi:hypothetical protein